MGEIARLFPTLAMDHVRQLGAIIVTERNAVAAINKVYSKATLGLGVLACQVVRIKVEQLARDGTYPWLRFVKGRCLAYAVVLGGVPLRIQPDNDEIRELMPEEKAAFRELREQLQLLPEANPSAVLRLEVLQAAGKDVDSIALYLFDERTDVTLDMESVYVKPSDEKRAVDETKQGRIIPFARPAEDVDGKRPYVFNDNADRTATKDEDARGE